MKNNKKRKYFMSTTKVGLVLFTEVEGHLWAILPQHGIFESIPKLNGLAGVCRLTANGKINDGETEFMAINRYIEERLGVEAREKLLALVSNPTIKPWTFEGRKCYAIIVPQGVVESIKLSVFSGSLVFITQKDLRQKVCEIQGSQDMSLIPVHYYGMLAKDFSVVQQAFTAVSKSKAVPV